MILDKPSTELSVLSYLDQNSEATQRELSEHIGISLGSINILVKRLVRKGLVKIERLQPTSVRYFLTPQGLASKIERTYSYIVRSYREVELVRARITAALRVLVKHNKDVYFYGLADDVALLLKEIVQSEFKHLESHFISQEALRSLKKSEKLLVITWDLDSDRVLSKYSIPYTNILGSIGVGGQSKDGNTNEE